MYHLFDDQALHRHIRNLEKPEPETSTRQPAPPKQPTRDDRQRGTLVYYNKLVGFICPAGGNARDRSQHYFVHRQALQRSGIGGDDVMVGAVLEYNLKPPRHPGGKLEAQDISIIEE
jgi:hypothetical protein